MNFIQALFLCWGAVLVGKKWVFRELVKDNRDYLGLMSYALYKHEKDETANGLRENGASDDKVEQTLKDFHDQVLMSPARLGAYKQRAAGLIDTAIKSSTDKLEAQYNELQEQLKREYVSQHKKLEKQKADLDLREKGLKKLEGKIRTEVVNTIKSSAQEYQKPHFVVGILKWLGSGFSGVVASVLVMVLTLGVLTMGDPESKHQLAVGFLKGLVTLLTGESMG
ncbi:hypothetical protein CGJ39_14135 [Vibrio parahaemolyticus]|nr:hypothetical protein CGJ39_14135 [Vibrio parahaemolyticus]